MAKYLDKNGLLYLVTKLKSMFVAQVSGKGLSTNDYTTAEKNKLAGIAENANNYVHPAYTPQASGLYKVTVDATGHVSAAAAAAKEDITALGIPGQDTTYAPATASANGLMSAADKSKLDGFGTADTYALKSDLSSVYKYKGSVASETDLPTSGNTSGDVYNVEDTGMNYAWDGTAWDPLGGSFDLEAISNQEIDTILAT